MDLNTLSYSSFVTDLWGRNNIHTVINLAAGITNSAPTIVRTFALVSYIDIPIRNRPAASKKHTTVTSRLNFFMKLIYPCSPFLLNVTGFFLQIIFEYKSSYNLLQVSFYLITYYMFRQDKYPQADNITA